MCEGAFDSGGHEACPCFDFSAWSFQAFVDGGIEDFFVACKPDFGVEGEDAGSEPAKSKGGVESVSASLRLIASSSRCRGRCRCGAVGCRASGG
jgi:hypothetical protein